MSTATKQERTDCSLSLGHVLAVFRFRREPVFGLERAHDLSERGRHVRALHHVPEQRQHQITRLPRNKVASDQRFQVSKITRGEQEKRRAHFVVDFDAELSLVVRQDLPRARLD